jgi:hypothetical protein
MPYKIYTERNLADTSRDPDEIVIEELGYKHNLDDAKLIASDYIKTRFFHKNTELIENRNGSFSATDFSSYGATIIIKPIIIT